MLDNRAIKRTDNEGHLTNLNMSPISKLEGLNKDVSGLKAAKSVRLTKLA